MQFEKQMRDMLVQWSVGDPDKIGREETVTFIVISGERADALGRIAMETIAALRGKPVKVRGASRYHSGAIYAPMTATAARKRFGRKDR